MGLENKTIVLLIDFEGHPAMGDEHTNHLRYSCLNGLLSIPDSDLYIISNHLQGISSDDKSTHLKMCEIEKMVAAEGRHTWRNIDPDKEISVKDIEAILEKDGYRIKNVILGGCNTAGCVLRTRGYSAQKWAEAGHNVQIYLPMCADYQLAGLNQAERNLKAFTIMYTIIKHHNLFDRIDIVRRLDQLKFKHDW
jgi:hypothetical protein